MQISMIFWLGSDEIGTREVFDVLSLIPGDNRRQAYSIHSREERDECEDQRCDKELIFVNGFED